MLNGRLAGFKKNVNRATTQVMMKTGTLNHGMASQPASDSPVRARGENE